MVFLGQRILRTVCAVGSSSKESRISSRSREPRVKNIATLMMMATGYCTQSFPWRGLIVKKTRTLGPGERPAGEWYHGLATKTHKVLAAKKHKRRKMN